MPLKAISKRSKVSSIKKRKPQRSLTPSQKSPKARHRYGTSAKKRKHY